ncbi:hypothetical protein MUN82_08805 [Hymenobacter aerilatus]|uniref:Uncharacterized protein n=1 Tax=Hymenobacter aerilatus TaxID=2932251 RepID=A0A8T9SY57_9BACT|nr:hypothetical protein [Hymenobacter aerilatus]UOR07182.1 hypothetical protein MUN82_08805 [Hymenobacter aerilatus]
MAYQPVEPVLLALRFRTNEERQPYPTRTYAAPLPSGNYLELVPKPGMQHADEKTPAGVKVAVHSVHCLEDLQESLAGRGRRQVLELK